MFLGSHVVIVIFVVLPCALIVTYSLAVTSRHVKTLWSFISYFGNRPLESCIFSLAISVCSALFALIVVLRYVQLCDVIEKSEIDERPLRKITKLNACSAALGLSGAFGLSLVASFQQKNLALVHVVGVFLCTYFTLTYFLIQTYFSFTLASRFTKKYVKIVRLLAVTCSSLILAYAPFLIAYSFFTHPQKVKLMESHQHQGGIYLQGALLEWALLIFFLLFIASFYTDLKKVTLTSDQILLLE